jgi:FKBP-type peptidyl-prolyl cis-trans isomerase SlyD
MKAQIISFHCTLKDPLGRVISSSFNRDVLTAVLDAKPSGKRNIKAVHAPAPAPANPAQSTSNSYSDFHEPIQGLVEGLQGLRKGEKRQIFVAAERAYGYYDPQLVLTVSRKKLPHGEALEAGFQVVTQADDGEWRVFRVLSADGQYVTLDGNHPLAGQDLFFDVEATATREATPDEIQRARATACATQLH